MKRFTFLMLISLPWHSLAQNPYLSEALHAAAAEKFRKFLDVAITWTMDGQLQGDFNAGYTYLQSGKPFRADIHFSAVISRDSMVWEAFYFRGISRKQLGKLEEARADMERVIRLNSKLYEGYIELARIYQLLKLDNKSHAAVYNARKLNPNRPEAYIFFGDRYLIDGQFEKARKEYKRCIDYDESFHDARIQLAVVSLLERNPRNASRHLSEILEKDSIHRVALLLRSMVSAFLNPKMAKRDASVIIRHYPDDPASYYLRGALLTDQQDYENAFNDFQKLFAKSYTEEAKFRGQQLWIDRKIDVQNAGAYTLTRVYGLPDTLAAKIKEAYCKIVIENFKGALAALDELPQSDKEPLVVYLKAVATEHLGDHYKAFTLYNRAVVLDRNIADAFKKRAIYYQGFKKWDLAAADFTEFIRLLPNVFSGYRLRGVSYYHSGQYEKAIADFTKYLQFDSSDMSVLESRGAAYYKLNKVLEASQDFVRIGKLELVDIPAAVKAIDRLVTDNNFDVAGRSVNIFQQFSTSCNEMVIRHIGILNETNRQDSLRKFVLNLNDRIIRIPNMLRDSAVDEEARRAATDWKKASEVCSALLRQYPEAYGLLQLRAVCRYYQRDYGNALKDCQEYSVLNPNSKHTFENIGVIKYKSDQKVPALLDFAKGGADVHLDFEALSHELKENEGITDTLVLIDLLTRVSEAVPLFTEATATLFRIMISQGRMDDIMWRIDGAIKNGRRDCLEEDRSLLISLKAVKHMREGDDDKALEMLRLALKIHPNNPVALFYSGKLNVKLGAPKKGKSEILRAAELGNKEARQMVAAGL